MFRLLSLILLLLLAVPVRAEMRFARTNIDLGDVKGGPIAELVFEFSNTGATPLEIIEIRPGCGCLTPSLDRLVVPAGESGKIGMKLRTGGQAEGPHAWRTHLRYRQADAIHEVALNIEAKIRNEVTVDPAILALHVENAVRQEIIVHDRREKTLRVTRVRASSPALKTTILPDGPGRTRLVIEVQGEAVALGRHDEMLDIQTDDPMYRQLQVPIVLSRQGRAEVDVSPETVRLSVTKENPVRSQLVRLRVSGTAKLEIVAVDADTGLSCTWASGPDLGATLKIQADLRQLMRTGAHAIRVRLTAPTETTLTIPVLLMAEE